MKFEMGDLVKNTSYRNKSWRYGDLFLITGFDEDNDLLLFSFEARDTINDYAVCYEKLEA